MRSMSKVEPWVGTWRPHRPRGPIAALYGSPGPKYALAGLTGAANHDATRYKAPMFSFGTRHECRPESSGGSSYLIPSNITRMGRDGTPAFSLHGRLKEPKTFQGPGPGKYSPQRAEKLTFASAPAYSLVGRAKDVRASQTPGIASYSLPPLLGHNIVTASTAPSFSFYGRSKIGSFQEDLRKSPGPAAYNVVDPCTYMKKPPQFSMTGRNFRPNGTTMTPGPGAHRPELVTLTKAKAPSFTFGLRHSEFITPFLMDDGEYCHL